MDKYILDYNKKQTIQLSNDAFYYLYYNEPPLDEDNLEEAKEIFGLFPEGFYIEDDWNFIEDSDLIEATFIPYIKDTLKYDAYKDLTKYLQLQIKWLDSNHIRAWLFDNKTGKRELYGDFNVYVDQFNNKCFHTGKQNENFIAGKMALYFLRNFKKYITKK